jgi:hypothetical protein
MSTIFKLKVTEYYYEELYNNKIKPSCDNLETLMSLPCSPIDIFDETKNHFELYFSSEDILLKQIKKLTKIKTKCHKDGTTRDVTDLSKAKFYPLRENDKYKKAIVDICPRTSINGNTYSYIHHYFCLMIEQIEVHDKIIKEEII